MSRTSSHGAAGLKPAASIEPLFEPFALRGVTFRNRFIMSPMTRTASPGGVPGENVAAYYRRRAENDVGLVTTEGVGIAHPAALGAGSMGEDNVPVLHGEAALAGWKHVVNEVHRVGGVIFPQLWHMGVMRVPGTGAYPDTPSSRPSGIWGPAGKAMLPPPFLEKVMPPTEPMTESEIADVIAAYARSAANARSVGFDGIAIHGAHGYLPDTFFWKETNLRTDQWGGDLVARARFASEVVKAIRAAIGPDLPIVFRYSQWKQQDYDARVAETPQELERLLAPLVQAGVDMFDVSTRIFSRPAFDGSELTLAGWTRKVTGAAVSAVGGVGLSKDLQTSFLGGTVAVNNLDQVMQRYLNGEFDMICVGRSLIMDPAWVRKARAGEAFAPFRLEAYGELY
jgi:2,4-dienoyl-CoA reductase-like NADH-dependent reductase (Old Yellow Enzyme family)